jgi:RecB family exonuclease
MKTTNRPISHPLPTPEEVGKFATAPDSISPSALDRFRECPRRFFWQDVLRIQLEEDFSEALAKALIVHKVLHSFFSLDPNDRSPEMVGRILRGVWREFVPKGVLPIEQERVLGTETEALLLRYYHGPFDMSVRPAAREHYARIRLKNGVAMSGRIDRLDHAPVLGDEAPGLDVVDYKTGRRELTGEELLTDSAMAFAAQATGRHRPVRALRHVYLSTEHEVRVDIEQEDVERMADLLVSLTSAVRSEREWPAMPGEHCRFCPFSRALLCPDADRLSLSDLPEVPDDICF